MTSVNPDRLSMEQRRQVSLARWENEGGAPSHAVAAIGANGGNASTQSSPDRPGSRAVTGAVQLLRASTVTDPVQSLRTLGQSLWLDNLTRKILDDGTLQRYIDNFGITGLTSNPTIFDQAIGSSDAYDLGIREKTTNGKSGEVLFFELALEDLRRAAQLFRPVFDSSDGVDGWVSIELSPLLAHHTVGSIAAAAQIHAQAATDNLLVKIPGTPAGLAAIEESIFNGIPVNVTLLFSADQYLAALHAYMRGVERRIAAGRDPVVGSVASLFVSRWDTACNPALPSSMRNKLGIAMAQRTYRIYREQLASPRWLALAQAGARPQRLLWASTGSKDAQAPDSLYVEALAAPDTINTMPEKTLRDFVDHGRAPTAMPVDGGTCEATFAQISTSGIDIDAMAMRLQCEGAVSFVRSWDQLLQRIADKAQTSDSTR